MNRVLSLYPKLVSHPIFQKRWVRITLYVLFYLASLLFFIRVTFPYDAIKQRIVAEYNGSQHERKLEIGELGGHFLFGVEAEQVKLSSATAVAAPSPMGSAEPPKVERPLEIESLRISPSIFSFLLGDKVVDFAADIGGGTLSGSFAQSEAEAKVVLHGEEIDISALGLLESVVGLPMGGTLSLDSEILLPERKAQKAEGKFELTISDLSIGDGKAKVRNTIALPKLNAGELRIVAQVTAGRMEISEFSAKGPDFELAGDGKVRLREPFDRSALDLELGFKFKEAYVTKSEMTKSIFGSPDGKIPGLFEMDPQVKQSKAEDGYYRWRVNGQLAHPSFRPAGAGGAKKGASSRGGANANSDGE